jgi:hypothetical protein
MSTRVAISYDVLKSKNFKALCEEFGVKLPLYLHELHIHMYKDRSVVFEIHEVPSVTRPDVDAKECADAASGRG